MRRAALLAVGTICVALGVAGIVLPLLPTTPFLLLASACYLRSSERLHGWLRGSPCIGGYVRAFENGGGIPRRAKIVAVALIWASMLVSFAVALEGLVVRLAFAAVGAAVSLWILTRPPAPASRPGDRE